MTKPIFCDYTPWDRIPTARRLFRPDWQMNDAMGWLFSLDIFNKRTVVGFVMTNNKIDWMYQKIKYDYVKCDDLEQAKVEAIKQAELYGWKPAPEQITNLL